MGLLVGWEEVESKAGDTCDQCGEIVTDDTIWIKSPPAGARGDDERICLCCKIDLDGDARSYNGPEEDPSL